MSATSPQPQKHLVILAGGFGTRLHSVLAARPKALAEVAGRSLLERQLDLAQKHEMATVHILIHHLAGQIREQIGDGKRWNIPVYYHEESTPRGTAGAVLDCLDNLPERFLVAYADTLLNVDLGRLWEYHHRHQADATLLVHPNNHPYDSDLIELDDENRIVEFHPTPHPDHRYFANLVNAALYVIDKASLQPWNHWPDKLDFARDLFPMMLANQRRLMGYKSREYIKDMGTPDRLQQGEKDIESGKLERLEYNQPAQAIFLDRDGTLNVEKNRITRHEDLELIEGSAAAVKQINEAGRLAVVITNQAVIARGECSFEGLRQIHNKLETCLGRERAYLDAIYFCPHHPHKGFEGEIAELKRECGCRKPATGLLDQAAAELNIDLQNSWFIGDTTADLATAYKAGMKSILLRTGYAGRDFQYSALPDFESYDLREAVDFILNRFPILLSHAQQRSRAWKPGEIVAIAGLSRAGKSTWASLCRIALASRGIKAHVIPVDSWIRPRTDRDMQAGVHGRFDLAALRNELTAIFARKETVTLTLPRYDRLERKQVLQNAPQIQIQPTDIVIIDGILAFDIPETAQFISHWIYIDCNETIRRNRFEREYQLRGETPAAIEALYRQRSEDEHPVIHSQRILAGEQICLAELESIDPRTPANELDNCQATQEQD